MHNLLRCLKSDFYKLKHTYILLIHLILPIIGAFLFLAYYSISPWDLTLKLTGYFEALSIVFPLIIGLISGMVIEMEEQTSNFQVMFTGIKSKSTMYLSKLILLILLGSFSTVLGVGIFAIGFKAIGFKSVTFLFYIKQVEILILANAFLYVFSVFINFKFGKGASIGIGIAGSLVSALMTTGLGDTIWVYIPWAWSARFCDFYILKALKPLHFKSISAYVNIYFVSMIIVTLISIFLSIIWFNNWEGRKSYN